MHEAPGTEPQARGSARVACGSIFLAPARAFDEIGRGARWIWPFLIVVALVTIGNVLMMPAQEFAMNEQFEQARAQNPQMNEAAMQGMRTFGRIATFIFGPLFQLLGIVVAAGVFTAVFAIAGLGLSYKVVFRSLAYASLISSGLSFVVMGIVVALNWNAGRIETPADIVPRLGLDLLGGEGVVRGLLAVVNLFSIWWLAVLVVGTGRLLGRTPRSVATPVLLAGIVWLAITGLLLSFNFRQTGS